MCVCVCARGYIHIYIPTEVHTCIHLYIYTRTHTHTRIRIHIHIFTCIRESFQEPYRSGAALDLPGLIFYALLMKLGQLGFGVPYFNTFFLKEPL